MRPQSGQATRSVVGRELGRIKAFHSFGRSPQCNVCQACPVPDLGEQAARVNYPDARAPHYRPVTNHNRTARLSDYIQLEERPPLEEPLIAKRRKIHGDEATVENELGHAPPDDRALLHAVT